MSVNSKGLQELRDAKVNVSRTPNDVLRKQLDTWDKIREANVVQGRRAMFPSYEFAADHYWKKR